MLAAVRSLIRAARYRADCYRGLWHELRQIKHWD